MICSAADQQALLAPAGNRDVRMTGFSRAVDDTAHDGHGHIFVDRGKKSFDLVDDRLHVPCGASAGRTGDEVGDVIDQTAAFQQLADDRQFVSRDRRLR